MNIVGIKRAKYVLVNIRNLNNRIIERERARAEFNLHLEKLKKRPTQTAIDKAKVLANNIVLKERKVGLNEVNNRKRIESLKKQISDLTKNQTSLNKKLEEKTKKSVYVTSKPFSNPKSELLKEHLEELEHKLQTSKFSKAKKEELNKKIKFLKKLL